jgi:hypothetical protein
MQTQESIREQLLKETEDITDELLKEVLDFLLFIKMRHHKKIPTSAESKAPFSSARYILENLNNIGTWEGDDLEECLQMVKNSRSQVDFFKHEPF